MKQVYKLLRRFPYVLAIIAGVVFYFLSLVAENQLSDLLVNISASLFTIPVVIFTYETIKSRLDQQSNRDLSEYVKMNIDREILDLLDKVSPLVIGAPTPGLNKVLKLLGMNEAKMRTSLNKSTIKVFYLSTDWGFFEDKIANLLANELVYNNLSIDERNAFIRLIKALRSIDYATDPRYYLAEGKLDEKYKVVKGSDFDATTKFKGRYLLLAKTKKSDQFTVAAFNDMKVGKYQVDPLTPMKPNKDGVNLLIASVNELLSAIKVWTNSRGDEFIIDSRNYKIRRNKLRNRLQPAYNKLKR